MSMRSGTRLLGSILLCSFIGAGVLLLAVGGLIAWMFGSREAAWQYLRGQEMVVIPSTIELRDCQVDEATEIDLKVMNLSSSPVTLTGMYTTCSCVVASNLPQTIPGHDELSLQIVVHSTDGRPFERQAILYTDSRATPELQITVLGEVDGRVQSSDVAPTLSQSDTVSQLDKVDEPPPANMQSVLIKH
jgi:hypothetical protein